MHWRDLTVSGIGGWKGSLLLGSPVVVVAAVVGSCGPEDPDEPPQPGASCEVLNAEACWRNSILHCEETVSYGPLQWRDSLDVEEGLNGSCDVCSCDGYNCFCEPTRGAAADAAAPGPYGCTSPGAEKCHDNSIYHCEKGLDGLYEWTDGLDPEEGLDMRCDECACHGNECYCVESGAWRSAPSDYSPIPGNLCDELGAEACWHNNIIECESQGSGPPKWEDSIDLEEGLDGKCDSCKCKGKDCYCDDSWF